MSRTRIRTVRNPVQPRKSVISGRAGGGKNGIDLIDIGAEPINRYGVVYITTIEAAEIAEHIGWIDGEIVRQKYAEMEQELRTLRAQMAALPLAVNTATEAYKDGLDELARAVNSGFDAALSGLDSGDPAPIPAWASATVAAVELSDSGRAQDLTAIDDGSEPAAGSDFGQQPVDDDGSDDISERTDATELADGDGDARVDGAADSPDDAAGGDVVDADGAGHHTPPRIGDIDAGDDDSAAGDE